jgi:fucose permease
MMPELRQHFSLTTAGLGAIIGAYFYAYAPAQVIAGAMVTV